MKIDLTFSRMFFTMIDNWPQVIKKFLIVKGNVSFAHAHLQKKILYTHNILRKMLYTYNIGFKNIIDNLENRFLHLIIDFYTS